MKRDMPPAFIKWVCLWSTVCVSLSLTETSREKIMSNKSTLSQRTDRELVKKRKKKISAHLTLGNVAVFPATTKSHFWDRIRVTVRLQLPDCWEAVCCFPACIQRADMNSGCWLKAATQQFWGSQTSLFLLARICCIYVHAYSTFPVISSVCLCHIFFFIACLYFFSNRFSATLKRSRPQSDSHTTLTAHSHIHGTLNHKSHSQGLGGSMWECEPT